MIIVLTIVGLVSGGALAFIYNYANPLIINNQKSETEKAIYKIFPEGKSFKRENIKELVVFKVKDKQGKLLGYSFLAEGNGYQGKIKMMVGINPGLENLLGIEIIESQETPGLGQEITNDDFKNQFKNLKTIPKITYVKNRKPTKTGEIEAITGATISSRAVVSILNKVVKDIRNKIK